MALILELEPETEARLRALALERGEAPEKLAATRLAASFLSPEEREELEDERDNAEAERRMANSDPSQRKSLDDLRRAWNL